MKSSHKISFAILGMMIGITYWRIHHLGFYYDDWTYLSDSAISPHSLKTYAEINLYARPIYSLIAWSWNLLAHGSEIGWQIFCSLTTFITALLGFRFFSLLHAQLGLNERYSKWAAVLSIAGFLFSPWSMAVTIWSTGCLTLWALIFFFIGYVLLNSRLKWRMAFAFIWFLASFLTYEAYWILVFPIALIIFHQSHWNIRKTLRETLVLGVPLIFAVLYQRLLLPVIVDMPAKTISAENLKLIYQNIVGIRNHVSIFYLASVTTLFLGAVILKKVSARYFGVLTLACVFGIALSSAIYGMAGYGLSGSGIMSRTMAPFSLFFFLSLGWLLGAILQQTPQSKKKKISGAFIFCILLCFVYSISIFVKRIENWTSIHQNTTQVLKGLSTQIGTLPKVAIIELRNDLYAEWFGASWEITGAMMWLKGDKSSSDLERLMIGRSHEWSTSWNGKEIIQSWCGAPAGRIVERWPMTEAPRVFTLNTPLSSSIEVKTMDLNEVFGCF